MPRRHHPTAEFPVHLEALYDRFPFERSLAQDPLSSVRPFRSNPRGAEVAGIYAATLAIGTTTSIRGAFARFVAEAGDDLPAFVEGATSPDFDSRLTDFKHRWIRGDQMRYLAKQLRELYREHGSLEEVFLGGMRAGTGDFAHGLDALSRSLREPAGANGPPPPGYARLFPSPLDSGSPCKRLVLYLRWMVRTEYPDLGIWRSVPSSMLRIPLDFHVFWIAFHLGLTQRRTRSWAAVEEITEALRRIDPMDPIKFDFVLCHTGISGDCPKVRDESVCGPCVVRPDCRLWHRVKWREAVAA